MSGAVRRFVEVAAPLEARVGASLVARAGELLTFGAAVHDQLNHSVHDAALRERASRSVVDTLRPGGLAFALALLCALALCAQRCALRYETKRLLRECGTPVAALAGKQHKAE